MNQSEVLEMNAKSRDAGASKKLRSVSIAKADNGGHVVEHRYDHSVGPYRDPEQHVFGKGEHEKMLAHVANALKLPEPGAGGGEEGDEDSAAGAAN